MRTRRLITRGWYKSLLEVEVRFMQTFNGKETTIHYNSDMSGDCKIIDKKTNTEMEIPCEDYSDEFLEEVAQIAANAKANNNIVTITFLYIDDLTRLPLKTIFSHATEIQIGECAQPTIGLLEDFLGIQLGLQWDDQNQPDERQRFKFRIVRKKENQWEQD